MTTCKSAIPIRSPDPKWYQESVATCMRCGEQYTSSVCGAGSSEQACGCGLVYRVETLTVDAVTCDDEVESANEASFWEAIH